MNKKLYKSYEDRKISGVCGGLGVYFGIDSTLIRLLWIIVSFITGCVGGILIYIACALIIPDEPDYFDAEFKEK